MRNPMLKSIFYARFHPERGPSVIHQHPTHSIIAPTSGSDHPPLITWSNITSYVIPPYDLCNHPLSISTEGCRVLGFPISIESPKYERNRFTFNVCFVLPSESPTAAWTPLVRKTAEFFRTMESEDSLLSIEETLPGLKWAGSEALPSSSSSSSSPLDPSSSDDDDDPKILPLLSQIFRDLNSFSEVSSRVSPQHVLNLRLSPSQPLGAAVDVNEISLSSVPLLLRPLPPGGAWTQDLTLRRIHPYVNGLNPVARIAELADAETKLVLRAVRELVLSGRATVMDLFRFSGSWAPTGKFGGFVRSERERGEGRGYIFSSRKEDRGAEGGGDEGGREQRERIEQEERLIALYAGLQPGLTLSSFALSRRGKGELEGVDLRRFVTFGVLKGFLRRVHRFGIGAGSAGVGRRAPVLLLSQREGFEGSSSPAAAAAAASSSANLMPAMASSSATRSGTQRKQTATGTTPRSKGDEEEEAMRDFDRAWRKAALSSGWATPPSGPPPASLGRSSKSADQVRSEEDEKLRAYLDGTNCMDKICVEMHLSEREVVERIRKGRFGEVVLFNK